MSDDLVKRPVCFRVLAHGNWLYFDDEQMAAESAEMHGSEYQGLYVRARAALPSIPERAHGEQVREAGGWQPIETAPKDGRKFLTWCKFYGVRVGKCHARADHDDWLSNVGAFGDSSKGGMRATHWRPLPLPPAEEPTGQ